MPRSTTARRGVALAGAATALALTTTLLGASAASAAGLPRTQEAVDSTGDVNHNSDLSTVESEDALERTDIDYVSFYPSSTPGDVVFEMSLDNFSSEEIQGHIYTRSIVARAQDFKYKTVIVKGKKKRKVVSRTPYTTRVTFVSTGEELPTVERLADDEWEPLDCYVSAASGEELLSDEFFFSLPRTCLGPSIDRMTSEFRTHTIDLRGSVFTDFAALGPVKP